MQPAQHENTAAQFLDLQAFESKLLSKSNLSHSPKLFKQFFCHKYVLTLQKLILSVCKLIYLNDGKNLTDILKVKKFWCRPY
jgi:hypothetical protein